MRLIKLINYDDLTRIDKKNIKQFNAVNTDEELIELTKFFGFNFKKNKKERAYKYFINEYNDYAQEQNEKIIFARKAKRNLKAKEKRQKTKNVIEIPINTNTATNLKKLVLKDFKNKKVFIKFFYKQEIFVNEYMNNVRGKMFDLARIKNKWDEVSLYFIIKSDIFYWDAFPNGRLIIYLDKFDKQVVEEQYFKNGVTNCLLTPIKNFSIDKINNAKTDRTKYQYKRMVKKIELLENKYNYSGVPQNEIHNIAEDLQIDITISTPFQDDKFIKCKSTKKCLASFKYLNSKFGHVDYITNKSKINSIQKEELTKIIEELDEKNKFYSYTRGLSGITSISTIDETYSIYDEDFDVISNFEKNINLNEIKINALNQEELTNFILDGTHYLSTIDFTNINKYRKNCSQLKHIDIKKAYATVDKCPMFQGFLGKITDFRQTDKLMGNGMYKINNIKFTNKKFKQLNDIMNIYINNCVYTEPDIKLLQKYATYDIICGCWGFDFNFDYTDEMLENKRYAKFIGCCNSINYTTNNYLKGNEQYANLLKNQIQKGDVSLFENEICVSTPKENVYHTSQLTAYSIAYTRITVIIQLMNMDINNIVRVCVDGIYYINDEPIMNNFQIKKEMNLGNDPGSCYLSLDNGIIEDDDDDDDEEEINLKYDCGVFRDHYEKELHIGQGGSGKTHYNLSDKGLQNILFVAPSWKLAREKQKEMNCDVNVVANLLCKDKCFNFRRYNVIIFDECSMMTNETKKTIFKLYRGLKLIFCGDVGYQLPPVEEEYTPFNYQNFDNIIEHKNDYRCNCKILKDLKNIIRDCIKNNYNINKINEIGFNYLVKNNRTIKIKDLKSIYCKDDLILCNTNNRSTIYNDMFSNIEKYLIKNNSKDYSNGDIVYSKPNVKNELRHGYTVHSIQGETAKNKLFIDKEKFFTSQSFYTAISRAKNINQIYLII